MRRLCSALAFLLQLVALPLAAWPAAAQTPDPASVIDAFEAARNRRDFDAAVALFADDAVITDASSRSFTGKDEIRRFLQGMLGRGRFAVITNRRVDSYHVAWTERPAGQMLSGVELAAEAVVYDGKIRMLAYDGSVSAGRADVAIDPRAQLPALLGLAAVLLVMGGLLIATSIGGPAAHSAAPSSHLRGRLLRELRGWTSARPQLPT